MPTDDQALTWLIEALELPPQASPFPWQLRLLAELRAGLLPRALDLPTGLGKTSVMAIWLLARALGAPVPRRLVYVVDRRVVVDQATAVAEGLREWVQRHPALQRALGLREALAISTLRGQHADNRDWLADPAALAIVIGTVDMVGSRLLFSGYGVSRKMRPYHAGLLGADTLLVLDEAHLVPPFERLLAQISSARDDQGRTLAIEEASLQALVPGLQLLTLSATGRAPAAGTTFQLDAEDLAHPVVTQRLHAPKKVRITTAVDAKTLPDTLSEEAWSMSDQGRNPSRIIVFANSRDHAQKVAANLLKLAGKAQAPDVALLVGGRRVHERTQAAQQLAALGFIAGTAGPFERPAFVVATAAGEVGIDLDATHAVCDVVAWERMVQRLGRVNRRGAGLASVAVVPAHTDDPAKAARQTAVLELLQQLPATPDGHLSASPAALGALKHSAEGLSRIHAASTPAPLHPPLTRALIDAWAMTSLEHHAGRPEVGPWLRGWPDEPEQPQACVVWRRHLPVDAQGQAFAGRSLEVFMDAAGPHLTERLEADLSTVLDWLLARARSLSAAHTPTGADEDTSALRPSDTVAVLVNDQDGQVRVLRGTALLAASGRPPERRQLELSLRGCTLWVDRRLGGLRDGLLDETAEDPADDVTEAGTPEQPGPVPFQVRQLDQDRFEGELPGWRSEASIPLRSNDDGVLSWLVVSSRLSDLAGSEEARSGAQSAQTLSEHQTWVEEAASTLAQRLQLPADATGMLTAAALVHDEGKKAPCWQQAFRAPGGGQPPYAKTTGRPDLSRLNGYRHEFGSLPWAEAHPRVQALPAAWRALCLHLVAAHHGAARPVIRTDGAAEPPSRAEVRAREVALRYAELSARWGPWGLAWWETLLRAADQQASRRNDEEGARHG